MAVNIRPRYIIRQAKAQRVQLPRYIRLDGGSYLIAAALLLSLMSLLTLGQIGRLATKGYEISRLQDRREELLRERSAAQIQLAEIQTIAGVKQRASEAGLRPVTFDQLRYVDVAPATTTSAPDGPQAAPAPDDITGGPGAPDIPADALPQP